METWFILLVSLCIATSVKSILYLINSSVTSKKLPPGPPSIPFVGNWMLLNKSIWTIHNIELTLRDLRTKYGPLITLQVGSQPFVFIFSRSLAHQALVQNGGMFSDRPRGTATSRIISSNQRTITTAAYGPTWRVLRRNLTAGILHPLRVKTFSGYRQWVLSILIRSLVGEPDRPIVNHFHYAMFSLTVLMLFGDKLSEEKIKEIETMQRRSIVSFSRFSLLNLWPRLGKVLFRKRWKELNQMRHEQKNLLMPLIRARIQARQLARQTVKNNGSDTDGPEKPEENILAYLDTLVDLELPEEKRKLNEDEIMSLCHEFLNASSDTTATALEWIMANLVKYPATQSKLYDELVQVVGQTPEPMFLHADNTRGEESFEIIKEDDLHRLPYLKAVVLEGLRRRPPAHFLLHHMVNQEVELDGYVIPKNTIVDVMVAEINWDPSVWDDPLEFRPERFLAMSEEAFDIKNIKEIKMLSFGAGRRICPGLSLALLHLEYYVANLIWYFEWKPVEGDDVDLSEKPEFTTVMKNPLRARLIPRA